MRKLFIMVLVVLLLAGGAVYTGLANPLIERQVAGALVQSGIGENRAECMAGRMVDRLTVVQLWKLKQAMAAREGEPENGGGLGEIVKRLRRVGDGEVVAVLGRHARPHEG